MRSVFIGTPAFLGRVDSETRCAFWAEEPVDHDFDQDRLIAVDLARTPSAAAAKEIGWDEVQVDDCFAGPNGFARGSTLGPAWPELTLSASIYLEQNYRQALPAGLRPACPPPAMEGSGYECMSVVYWPHLADPRAGRRYAGHHAVVTDERDTIARLEVYPPGTSLRSGAQPVTMWIDLASAEQCDAGPQSLTVIGVGDAPKAGPVFLICGQLEEP
ncbi:MAG TPA: hypothetical protein VJT31_00825 [Rugosimonospora sp.]|nr:hypothetical protein [Rugosimonospora sp.]